MGLRTSPLAQHKLECALSHMEIIQQLGHAYPAESQIFKQLSSRIYHTDLQESQFMELQASPHYAVHFFTERNPTHSVYQTAKDHMA